MSAFLISFLAAFPGLVSAQIPGPKPLITQAVNETKLTRLAGNTHPLARPEFDHGAAPSALPMQRMLLVLTRIAEQQAALQTLLQEQQDQSSPSFHKWLTPGEFGQQFGPSGQDVQTVTTWLAAHGFQVTSVSNGRNVIRFSGTAAQVQEAFHTTIHSYVVNGGQYWANDTDPQIPTALAAVVVGVDSLDSFPRKPMHHLGSMSTKPAKGGQVNGTRPLLTYQCGTNPNTGGPLYCNGVTPYDFATIYNVLPLWNATPPIDGNGQAIAIVGRSNINVQDVSDFRSVFGLPPNPPQVILDGPDPGLVQGDETEADLDVEWAGAVARSATIKLVVSESTETTDGVDLSALYIVDNNAAPIMSESFLGCELDLGAAGNQFYKNLWEQAAAQGISVFVSAGDQGSAGCDFFQGTTPQPARDGLQVNGIASTPYNVAVGGTDFNDFSNPLLYWNVSNNPTTQQSAKGYIPETTWNDTCTNAVFASVGFSTNPETNCNNSQLSGTVRAIGGSGGKSNCTTPAGSTASSCAGGYAKPPWQTGNGVPVDNKRDLPDVSLFAGAGFIGNSYVICEDDLSAPCGTNPVNIGGTSASSPAFAGLLALVDQKMASRQGNPNFILYKLAAQQPASSCNSTTGPAANCAFNDVTSGTIAMPCATGTLNCTTSNSGDQFGILSGYNAAPGYDLATGLGSVNANNMVSSWSSVKFTASSTTLTLNGDNAVNVTHGAPVNVSVSVSPTSPQPTGDVSLIATQGTNTTDVDTLTLSSGTASGSTNMLPGGASYNVKAHYAGDATYGGSDSNAVTVKVTPEASQTALRILTFDPIRGQLINPNATTFNYGSAYLLRADVTNNSGTPCFNTTSETQSYACPTGNVALTDNGSAAGPGTFALNSQGSTEFQAIQLSGGSHTLAGSYSGDNSYNASSTTDPVTVMLAPTTTAIAFTIPIKTVIIGPNQGLYINAVTQSNSTGAAPGGTYTVMDGSTQLTASVNTQGSSGSATRGASLNGNIDVTLSPPTGPHTLTITYGGDSNYASSAAAALTVQAVYGTQTVMTATPSNIVYGYGTNVTVTATVDTTNPASNASLKPTGTISFAGSEDGPITNPVTTTVTQDANGNWELQATVTLTPKYSDTINANYSGDLNYASSYGFADINVIVPDFTVTAGSSSMVITAGQTITQRLTITPLTSYNSTVQLSCVQTSAFPGSACSISPSSVTLSNGTPATATLTITTLAPSTTLSAVTVPTQLLGAPFTRLASRTLAFLSGLAAFLLLSLPKNKRSPGLGRALGLICLASLAIGCGGGASANSGGGGGGGGNTPASTTTTLTASAVKIPQGTTATLSATIQSTAHPTGTVLIESPNCSFQYSNPLTNGTAQIATPTWLAPGTCTVSAAYSGDSNNQPSQSGNLNVAVTGNTGLDVEGLTGSNYHLTPVSITIQ